MEEVVGFQFAEISDGIERGDASTSAMHAGYGNGAVHGGDGGIR